MSGPNYNKALEQIRNLKPSDFEEKIGGIICNNSLLAGVVVIDNSADAPIKKRELAGQKAEANEREALDNFIAEANEILKQKKTEKSKTASNVVLTEISPTQNETETYLSAYEKNKDVFKDAIGPYTVTPDDINDTKKLIVKDPDNNEVKFEIYPDGISSNRCDAASCDAMLECNAIVHPDGTPAITVANDEAKQAMEDAIGRYKEKNPDSHLYDNVTVNIGKLDADTKAAPSLDDQNATPRPTMGR